MIQLSETVEDYSEDSGETSLKWWKRNGQPQNAVSSKISSINESKIKMFPDAADLH